jgi:hypothetical protein
LPDMPMTYIFRRSGPLLVNAQLLVLPLNLVVGVICNDPGKGTAIPVQRIS